ncbi:MAG TPA: 50S ribosomal protein L10 [Candidatus Pacearchaeota archaeon]|nr:50S ribosomal protein L10 [Candidatus Pacearchaeota archaeon]HOK94406.1 50S ribosomal protein L10 [Candidatus Pacearchaeota archaeon]HPO75479.1 50S ribosomal protein L10 [Candidatus Pacearchaeota archaeon]
MLNKQQKKELVKKLREKLKESKLTVVCNFEGLSVEKQRELKKKVKESIGELTVVKRRLLQRVFLDEKINFPEISGSVMVAFGKDEVSPAKVIYQFSKKLNSKKEKLDFVGGVIKKEKNEYLVLSKEDLIEIASLPSREELLARFASSISAPLLNFISVLQGNIKGLIYIISQRKSEF